MGADDVLYVVARDGLHQYKVYLVYLLVSKEEGKKHYQGYEDSLYDTERIKELPLKTGEQPDRLVALANGGALLVARHSKEFWQIIGTPVRDQPKALYRPDTPRPLDEFKERQRIEKRTDLVFPDAGEMIAIAANPRGQVAVLLYPDDLQAPAQVILIEGDTLSAPVSLAYAIAPFSIGWVEANEWALLFKDQQQAIVYRIPFLEESPTTPVKPMGHRYPLNWGLHDQFKNKIFVNSLA